jgi:DnaK suppressor protein
MTDAISSVLAEKRAVLEAQLEAITATPQDLGGISFGKRVGEGTSLAVERLSQIASHDRLHATLSEVHRAEEKLATGSYGICDRCERPLAAERLDAMPWATRCVTCAARYAAR